MEVNNGTGNEKQNQQTSQGTQGTRQVTLSAQDIRERCATDLDMLAVILKPDVATTSFPPYYHMLWQLFTSLELGKKRVFRFT